MYHLLRSSSRLAARRLNIHVTKNCIPTLNRGTFVSLVDSTRPVAGNYAGLTSQATQAIPRTQSENDVEEAPFVPPPKSPKVAYFLPFQYRKPEKVLRYEIGKVVGSGNFATVFEATDKETGDKVAIKVMDKATCPRQLCQQELRILRQIQEEVGHRRLTPIIDVFETPEKLCFVLELFTGGDFYEHVVKNGRMSERDAAVVTRKLIYALEALHRHGIIHRDIKLENILLEGKVDTDNGFDSFKLADFGYAKKINEDDIFRNPAGTLGYVAPEVLERRQYGPACDVWSVGVVLYTLLAGFPPFPHKEVVDKKKLPLEQLVELELEAIHYGRQEAVWNEHLTMEPWNQISMDAKKLVSKMLRIDPKRRYTTSQVLDDPWIKRATNMEDTEYLNFE